MNLEKKINDVKHDTGLPGKPRKYLFFENFPKLLVFLALLRLYQTKLSFFD